MDNIRASIETLFQQINSSTILSHLWNNEKKSGTLGVDEEMFCQKFMVENKCYTLDQVHELYLLFQSEWCKWPVLHERSDHSESNLFYVLLHYTQNMLVEQDGEPVCRYNQLLRWRILAYKLGEDLMTTSFLAFKELQDRHKRKYFYWPFIIKQDNPAINNMLGKGVTDLHFHLYGSSLNFELTWIALMNRIKNRRRTFVKLKKCLSYRTSTMDSEKWDTFYRSTMKACLIRYYLFCVLMGKENNFDADNFLNLLLMDDDILGQSVIQNLINVERYHSSGTLDYAFSTYFLKRQKLSQTDVLLSGERLFLYRMFYRIYSGVSSYKEQVLFYVYLLQKTQVRRELIQLNEKEGFHNFSDYECRKSIFIENDKRYNKLVPKLAIDTAFSLGNLKYLECRISPRKNSRDLLQTIASLDRQIRGNGDDEDLKKKYFYILHFIKRADNRYDFEDNDNKDRIDILPYRHFRLRQDIRMQGMATLDALNRYPKLRNRIIGIDAANTELYCRPEVFGPIYRYMKRFCCKDNPDGSRLRYTFHVGEDFWDITDGLRAIDEAILFLNLDTNDRLGHALALGIGVREYYQTRNFRVIMSKQNALDNAMWLIFKANELGIKLSPNVEFELRQTFDKYYEEIYLGKMSKEKKSHAYSCLFSNTHEYKYNLCRDYLIQGRNIYVYYQSWLQRGDDPEFICSNKQCETLWGLTARNQYNECIILARQNHAAKYLSWNYYYNKDIRKNGNNKCEVKIIPEIITLIEEIQRRMCCQIARKHLAIETNITSNKFIGGMNQYIQHPIVKMYQLGLNINNGDANCPQLSVSVNTDDRGIFDTSIENEYALLALALEKEKDQSNHFCYQGRYVYEWLNNIRKMGFEQRFRTENASEY